MKSTLVLIVVLTTTWAIPETINSTLARLLVDTDPESQTKDIGLLLTLVTQKYDDSVQECSQCVHSFSCERNTCTCEDGWFGTMCNWTELTTSFELAHILEQLNLFLNRTVTETENYKVLSLVHLKVSSLNARMNPPIQGLIYERLFFNMLLMLQHPQLLNLYTYINL